MRCSASSSGAGFLVYPLSVEGNVSEDPRLRAPCFPVAGNAYLRPAAVTQLPHQRTPAVALKEWLQTDYLLVATSKPMNQGTTALDYPEIISSSANNKQ